MNETDKYLIGVLTEYYLDRPLIFDWHSWMLYKGNTRDLVTLSGKDKQYREYLLEQAWERAQGYLNSPLVKALK